MKQIILLLVAVCVAVGHVSAARYCPASGHVINEQGESIGFATVVLLQNTKQIAGMATDAEGRFTLKAPAGDYTLSIQYLGYEPIQQEIHLMDNTDLGDFTLRTSAMQIGDVVVQAQLVRREADRFVVDVANSPAAIGRDGEELLQNAPGVWIQDGKVSINGKEGTQVYINDRLLRMDAAQLSRYLRGLKAGDIQKIEVIPSTGADFDADSSSGIVKITLKRRRDDGITGDLSFYTYQGKYISSYNPSGSINFHSGRWSLSGDAWGSWDPKSNFRTNETTEYYKTQGTLTANSGSDGWQNNGGGRLGAIFEVSDRHSLGVQAEYWADNQSLPVDSWTRLAQQGVVTDNTSHYNQPASIGSFSATFNYIWKIDTLGSAFKVLADYSRNRTDSDKDYFMRSSANGVQRDSLYRNFSLADYSVVSGTVSVEKNFTPTMTLRAGAKYTFNDMKNSALYEYDREGWLPLADYSFDVNYREHISALYAVFSARTGRWSFVAGLRGEYTYASGNGNYIKQDYLSLFPNANVSYALTKDGAYSLTAQYSRNITRPSFWALNPQRIQISDYTYQTGNPLLRPCFSHNLDLTLVVAQKYSLTAGMQLKKDDINQAVFSDPENPNAVHVITENFADVEMYHLSAYLPFQLTKWWTINANLTYAYYGQRLTLGAPEIFRSMFHGGGTATFTLPKKFYITADYFYRTKFTLANMEVGATHTLNMGLKKRFLDDRLTAGVSFQNILDKHQVTRMQTDDFSRLLNMYEPWSSFRVQVSVSYNFKSGKNFRKRSVESGAAEEKSRM